MDQPRIIVVDDEADLRLLIADYFGRHGFSVRTAASGAELDACLAEQAADLIMLDVNMPVEDGFSIARRIRAQDDVPIIMVTSETDMVDRVVSLEFGVDDYVTKPFDLRELRARVRSVLRRAARPISERPAAVDDASSRRQVPFGAVVLDMEAYCLIGEDGSTQALTAMEFALLEVFAANPNRVLSRDRLLDLAHSSNRDPFDRSIDIRVTRLRRKIEVDPSKPAVIKTVRGAGYMFVPVSRNGVAS
ncbi:response regulator [Phenylobacterium sp. LjRoot225]|uniref:response regulator n=1 Tax=Phenylobacterium sp. LjRoot225 TaxID=3342285 RepID=UPI003ECFE99F